MANSRNPSPAELLLQLLELTSLGAAPAEQINKQLRRSHPFARLDRRVKTGLQTLEAEGLIESIDGSGRALYRATPNGLATLEEKGRFPGGAAVLFTDIVGSTDMIAELGEDGAHKSRQRHFTILREAVVKCGGREVKSLGDGLMVIFAEPAAAIDCAAEMQRRVARDRDGLGLRVGVHAGELLREDNDYFGSTVIIARRLCDVAETGQTIVSDEASALSSGGQTFQSLGPIALKGLNEPVPASTLVPA